MNEFRNFNPQELLARVSQSNCPRSLFELGWRHYKGDYGLEQDFEKSHQYWLASAKQGYSKAQSNLGSLLTSPGKILGHDPEKGVYWLRLAVQQGNPYAKYRLGVCYLYGVGVAEDREKSKDLLLAAVEDGNEWAITLLKKGFGMDVKLPERSPLAEEKPDFPPPSRVKKEPQPVTYGNDYEDFFYDDEDF